MKSAYPLLAFIFFGCISPSVSVDVLETDSSVSSDTGDVYDPVDTGEPNDTEDTSDTQDTEDTQYQQDMTDIGLRVSRVPMVQW